MIFPSRGDYAYWRYDIGDGNPGWLGGQIENLGDEIGQEFVLTNSTCIENTDAAWSEWRKRKGWVKQDNYLTIRCYKLI